MIDYFIDWNKYMVYIIIEDNRGMITKETLTLDEAESFAEELLQEIKRGLG